MIEERTRAYLEAVDERLPGYVRGLYVVGSAALGAWQPGRSDIDTVILTSRGPTADDLAALAGIHAAMPREPDFDGVYLDPALAATWPADRRVVPFVVRGEFRTGEPCGELTPVLSLTLRRYGRRVRGPAVEDLDVRVDADELRRYNLDNLRDYWQGTAAEIRTALAGTAADADMDADSVAWCVLGPARLHYTLTNGDVIAKSAAGHYLAKRFPEYAGLAHRSIGHRAGHPQRFTAADLLAAADSIDAVATDAWDRFADSGQGAGPVQGAGQVQTADAPRQADASR